MTLLRLKKHRNYSPEVHSMKQPLQDITTPLIYLNNAATTWPKPPEVLAEVTRCLQTPFFEHGRSTAGGSNGLSLCNPGCTCRFFPRRGAGPFHLHAERNGFLKPAHPRVCEKPETRRSTQSRQNWSTTPYSAPCIHLKVKGGSPSQYSHSMTAASPCRRSKKPYCRIPALSL